MNFASIPIEYVEVLVDFLYDNSAARLLEKKYSEAFITNMIVITDQLFVDRLKDVFQVHVLKRYTMKRSAEWLELAFTYHCDLLKKAIFEFLCLNLREVLENRYLEHVNPEYLVELDERYREVFPEIKHKLLVPRPSPEITFEYVESFVGDFVVDLTEGAVLPQKSTPKTPKEAKSLTKTKIDYEKEGKLSLQFLDEPTRGESQTKAETSLATILSDESARVAAELLEKNKAIWTKVAEKKPEPKRKAHGVLNANEVLRNEGKMCENFSNLKLALRDDANEEASLIRGAAGEKENDDEARTPSQFNSPIVFGDFFSPPSSAAGRMSQKQRKRQSSSRASESEGGETTPGANVVPKSVWNIPSADVQLNGSSNGGGGVSVPLDLSTESKRKVNTTPTGRKSQEVRMINFDKILLDELREKEYYTKLKTKSLALTQLEESAISELAVFYNVDQVFDETIVVARKVRVQVSQNFSQWAKPHDSSAGVVGNGFGDGDRQRMRTTSSGNHLEGAATTDASL